MSAHRAKHERIVGYFDARWFLYRPDVDENLGLWYPPPRSMTHSAAETLAMFAKGCQNAPIWPSFWRYSSPSNTAGLALVIFSRCSYLTPLAKREASSMRNPSG